jgi:hypothetical protein
MTLGATATSSPHVEHRPFGPAGSGIRREFNSSPASVHRRSDAVQSDHAAKVGSLALQLRIHDAVGKPVGKSISDYHR